MAGVRAGYRLMPGGQESRQAVGERDHPLDAVGRRDDGEAPTGCGDQMSLLVRGPYAAVGVDGIAVVLPD